MHVLIAGGGVAGSVTAMALQQAGIQATIFEAHPPTEAEIGSYFTISPNGLDALDAVGALHLVTAAAYPTRRTVLWDAGGHRLGAPGLGGQLPDGTVAQTIKRARLTRILLDEAIRRGIPVEFGRRLEGATIDAGGGVTASFQDGSRANGDLLVGADGIHSVTRRLIDPLITRGGTRSLAHDLRPPSVLWIPGGAQRRCDLVRELAASGDNPRRANNDVTCRLDGASRRALQG